MSDTPKLTPKKQRRNRTSLYLSLLAILISLVGTGVSIFETRLLREQQDLMIEEKAASVWPYVRLNMTSNQSPNTYTIGAKFINKGVGPALLGNIQLFFADEQIPSSELFQRMEDAFPELQLGASSINLIDERMVLSPGEEKTLYSLSYTTERTQPTVLLELLEKVRVEACYCSIYGDCWSLGTNEVLTREENCSAKLDLR